MRFIPLPGSQGAPGATGDPGTPGPALARRLITIPYTLLTDTEGTAKTLTSVELASLAAFPANTAVLAGYAIVPTAFQAPSLTRLTVDLGFSGALTWFLSGIRCESISTGIALNGTIKLGELGGIALVATIGSVGANLSALTQGSVSIYLYHAPATTDA